MHCEADAKMSVVIEIGAGGNDPIDKSRFDQRNQCRNSQPRRRERAGERHPDSDFRLKHLPREELTGFPQDARRCKR